MAAVITVVSGHDAFIPKGMRLPVVGNVKARTPSLRDCNQAVCPPPSLSAVAADGGTVLATSGAWVNVTFSNLEYAQKTDWVGLYRASEVGVVGTQPKAPIRYQMIGNTTFPYTNGMVRFKLTNLRGSDGYVFVVVHETSLSPFTEISAISNPVTFARPNEPLAPRLALTATGTMQLSWTSGPTAKARVIWAPNHTALGDAASSSTAIATASTYLQSEMCGPPANTMGWRDPGMFYTAEFTGLVEGRTYSYTFGSDEVGWSNEKWSFMAPVKPKSKMFAGTSLIAFGDMGKSPVDGSLEHSWDNYGRAEVGSIGVASLLEQELETDLVLHIGDIAYAVGYQSEWDEFHEQIRHVSGSAPYMTCMGNHEFDTPGIAKSTDPAWVNGTDSGGECGIPYMRRFQMPRKSEREPWYNFTIGDIAVIMMDTEADYNEGTAQYAAIEAMLHAVDRSVTPWLIVAGHRPMYLSSKYPEPSADPTNPHTLLVLEPMFIANRVDLFLAGHHHSYQRTCPIAAGKCQADRTKGVVHMVIGMAGYSLSGVNHDDKPEFTAFQDDAHYGFTRVQSQPDRGLVLQYVAVQANGTGTVADEYVLAPV